MGSVWQYQDDDGIWQDLNGNASQSLENCRSSRPPTCEYQLRTNDHGTQAYAASLDSGTLDSGTQTNQTTLLKRAIRRFEPTYERQRLPPGYSAHGLDVSANLGNSNAPECWIGDPTQIRGIISGSPRTDVNGDSLRIKAGRYQTIAELLRQAVDQEIHRQLPGTLPADLHLVRTDTGLRIDRNQTTEESRLFFLSRDGLLEFCVDARPVRFSAGARVRVTGLTGRPEFIELNGRLGSVAEWIQHQIFSNGSQKNERYTVILDRMPADDRERRLSLAPENIEPPDSPPGPTGRSDSQIRRNEEAQRRLGEAELQLRQAIREVENACMREIDMFGVAQEPPLVEEVDRQCIVQSARKLRAVGQACRTAIQVEGPAPPP